MKASNIKFYAEAFNTLTDRMVGSRLFVSAEAKDKWCNKWGYKLHENAWVKVYDFVTGPPRNGAGFCIPICIPLFFTFLLLFSSAYRVFGKEKSPETVAFQGFVEIEVAGFEPTTFWSRTKRA